MVGPLLIQLDSVAAIRAAGALWDDLWRRSDVSLPIARAELIAQWIEHCAPTAPVHALAVENNGQLVAALPLVGRRVKRVLPVGRLPANNWSWAGDLLIDPSPDGDEALRILIRRIAQLGWPLLWFDAVPYEMPHWRRFIAAANVAGLAMDIRESFRVGQVEIDHDWAACQRRWSKNHRRQLGRIENRAEQMGGVDLAVHRDIAPQRIEALLRRGFDVEDRSWKAAAGTSVLRSPGSFQFYLRQARQIAEWGELQLTFLEHQGQPIAFEYGWNAKGCYFSPKVGYDEAFARLSPGQLLRRRLLERFCMESDQQLVDFVGPLSDATSKWATATYPVGRLVLSTGSRTGQMLVRAYNAGLPSLRRIRAHQHDGLAGTP
jgi:CelD/BcsL family acetyltransferase involved in cellulose biosynthesis